MEFRDFIMKEQHIREMLKESDALDIQHIENALPPAIKGFRGGYRWLSNFWPATVTLDGITYPTTEHAYQAAKTLDPEIRQQIAALDKPGKTKRFARKIQIRPDWDNVKLAVMEDLIRQKFNIPELREKLLATGDAYIEETNTWGDRFYGVSGGVGLNHLGKIIMKVRDELQKSMQ